MTRAKFVNGIGVGAVACVGPAPVTSARAMVCPPVPCGYLEHSGGRGGRAAVRKSNGHRSSIGKSGLCFLYLIDDFGNTIGPRCAASDGAQRQREELNQRATGYAVKLPGERKISLKQINPEPKETKLKPITIWVSAPTKRRSGKILVASKQALIRRSCSSRLGSGLLPRRGAGSAFITAWSSRVNRRAVLKWFLIFTGEPRSTFELASLVIPAPIAQLRRELIPSQCRRASFCARSE